MPPPPTPSRTIQPCRSDAPSLEKFQSSFKTLKPAQFPTSARRSLLSLKPQDRIIISAPTIIKADKQRTLICLKQSPRVPRCLLQYHQRTHPRFSHSAEQQPLNIFSFALLVSSAFPESSRRKRRNQHTEVIQSGLWEPWSIKTFQQYLSA